MEDYPLLITTAPASGGGLEVPTLEVLTTPTAATIRWQGDPAYSSQFEQSGNLANWSTFGLPQQETAGVNETSIPPQFLTGRSASSAWCAARW
ncbi:MAG: hypothetical protein R3F11_15485 [Verrucomicrobiales bacterium]